MLSYDTRYTIVYCFRQEYHETKPYFKDNFLNPGGITLDFEDVAKGTNVPYDRLVAATQALKKLGVEPDPYAKDAIKKSKKHHDINNSMSRQSMDTNMNSDEESEDNQSDSSNSDEEGGLEQTMNNINIQNISNIINKKL